MTPEYKYDVIGRGYNKTRCADPYLTSRLAHLLKPATDAVYLDIGCGTGNYTIALANMGMKFYGADPSEKMLQEARSRSRKVSWIQGMAELIPTSDGLFDGVMATLTIHHWNNLQSAFTEIRRVMKDTGRLVLFTATPEQMKGYWLNHYFPAMLEASAIQMPSPEILIKAASEAGLKITGCEPYFVLDEQEDLFLYSGKNRPGLYFEEAVRQGISSFAALANAEEVEHGLLQLKSDIDNGSFETIKNSYNNGLGDYLFITLQKEWPQ